MDMPKLLIADSNEEFRQALFDFLCRDYHIKVARDGVSALELLRTYRPDLLVLDILLPGLDGVTLLQRAREEEISPTVLVLNTFPSEYICSALARLEVSYIMSKPCDISAIADRLADFAAELIPCQLPAADLNSAVANLLIALGFPTRLDGFLFLQAGIPMYMKDPGQSMTKELYVAIGKLYGKDRQQVERSIRSAIDIAWRKGDPHVWRQYFGVVDAEVPRPPSNEFFGRIATALAQQGYRTHSA